MKAIYCCFHQGAPMALLADWPNLDPELFQAPSLESLGLPPSLRPAPKVLLYGSLRERSFSRLAVEEAVRLLNSMGAETHIFNQRGLPLPDAEDASHPYPSGLTTPGGRVVEAEAAVCRWCPATRWAL